MRSSRSPVDVSTLARTDRGGRRLLSGTFAVFPLAEVLSLVERSAASGALVVRGREVDGTLYFAGGELCGGEVSDLSGPVADAAALEIRLLEVCVSLLRSRDAEFEFRADETPPWPAPLMVAVDPILTRATDIAREWPAIMTAVESFDSVLERTGTITDESITLTRIGFRVLDLVDGQRTIRELARGAEASLIVVGPEVRTLVRAGAVRVIVGAERALSSARADAERAARPSGGPTSPADADLVDVSDWGADVRDSPVAATPTPAPPTPPVPSAPPAPEPAPVPTTDDLERERADLAARAGLAGSPSPEAAPEPAPAPVVERSEIVVDRSELLRMFSGLKDD